MKIEVFESALSFNVIATFSSKAELFEWNKTHNVHADCIAIDDQIVLGWDEL